MQCHISGGLSPATFFYIPADFLVSLVIRNAKLTLCEADLNQKDLGFLEFFEGITQLLCVKSLGSLTLDLLGLGVLYQNGPQTQNVCHNWNFLKNLEDLICLFVCFNLGFG